MSLAIPNRFVNGQTIDGAKFNSNFDAISSWAGAVDADVAALETLTASHTSDITALQATVANGSFYAYLAAEQAISSATTYTTLMVDDTGLNAFDGSSYFTVATATYLPAVAGAYRFDVNVQVKETGFDSGESVIVYIVKNATTRIALLTLHDSYAHGGGASIILKANGTTDTFILQVYVSSGTNTVISSAFFCGCMVEAD